MTRGMMTNRTATIVRGDRAPGGYVGRLAITLAICVFLAMPGLALAGEVRIWPTAVVSDREVTLKDVAEFVDFSRAARDQLEATIVAPSPCEGGEALLTIEDVRRALVDGGANLADVRLLGASRCKVSRPLGAPRRVSPPMRSSAGNTNVQHKTKRDATAQPVPGKVRASRDARTLETAVRDFLAARLSEQPGRVDVRFSRANQSDLALPAESHQFEIHAASPVAPGLVTLEVQAHSVEGELRAIPLVAEVAVLREVVVARRPINRGRLIEPADLAVQARRFTDAAEIGLTDVSAAAGQRARDFIPAGAMVTAGSIEAAPVVERGDAVTIWIRRGGVVVKASGRAQQAGGLGDVISVRREGTKRKQDLIEAVVTGPGTVTISDSMRLASR